ncbi:MAG: ATP synthase F0 subunit B [Bdellovibrionota bacterium]
MLTPDWTFFPQLAVFLATVAVLNLVLFGPVRRILAEREEGTTQTAGAAEDLRAEARRLEADYEGRLRGAREQATAERAKLRGQGQEQATKIVEEARAKADQISDQLASELSRELDTARKALESQAREISAAMVGRLIGKA